MKKLRDKKEKQIIIWASVGTGILLLVGLFCALYGMSRYYYNKYPDDPSHGWKYIGQWFNPFAPGNWWAGMMYLLIGSFIVVLILLLHHQKMKGIK